MFIQNETHQAINARMEKRMKSVVLRQNTAHIDKPWSMVVRSHDLSGTDYVTICNVDDDVAQLLADEGIEWLFGEPDWEKHFADIEKRKAQRDLKAAAERVAELTAKVSVGAKEV